MNAVVTESLPMHLRSWIKPGDAVRLEFGGDLPTIGRYVAVFVEGTPDPVLYTPEDCPYFRTVA